MAPRAKMLALPRQARDLSVHAARIRILDANRFDLLITPYGSAFPKRAWRVMLKYLRAGGNWLNLGGVPLTRPVVFTGNRWKMEAPQTAYHKRLGITHSFAVNGDGLTYKAAPQVSADLGRNIKARQIYELYVRLSSSSNEPDEAGSDGPHEGVVRPLLFALNQEGRPIAAAHGHQALRPVRAGHRFNVNLRESRASSPDATHPRSGGMRRSMRCAGSNPRRTSSFAS